MATVRPTTVLAATASVGIAAFVGYAIYFDHRRRTDVEFRKALKRESRREARLAKDQAQEQSKRQKEDIRRLYQQSEEEGFPTGDKEQEDYFMTMIQEGEELSRSGELVEAAYSFYRALKVYPSQRDLVNIYDKTVAKPVLDILAEFIALDSTIRVDAPAGGPGSAGTRSGSSVKSGGDSVHGVDD